MKETLELEPPYKPRYKPGDEVLTEFGKFAIVSPISGWANPGYQNCWYYHVRPIHRALKKVRLHIIRENEVSHPQPMSIVESTRDEDANRVLWPT